MDVPDPAPGDNIGTRDTKPLMRWFGNRRVLVEQTSEALEITVTIGRTIEFPISTVGGTENARCAFRREATDIRNAYHSPHRRPDRPLRRMEATSPCSAAAIWAGRGSRASDGVRMLKHA
jgi:hypothetical protein